MCPKIIPIVILTSLFITPVLANDWDMTVTYEREKLSYKTLPYQKSAKDKYQTHATTVVKYNHDVDGLGSFDFNVQSYYVTGTQQHSRLNVASLARSTHDGNTWRWGRMVLSQGVAYGYEPLDVLHKKDNHRLFSVETKGVDGISYERYLDSGDMRLLLVQQNAVDNRVLKTWSKKPDKKRTIAGIQSNQYWDDAEIMVAVYQMQLPTVGTSRVVGAGISQPIGDNIILYASGVQYSKMVDYVQVPHPHPVMNAQNRFQPKNVGRRSAYTTGINYTMDTMNTNIIAEYSQRPVGLSKNNGAVLVSILNNPRFGVPSATNDLMNAGMRKQSLIRFSPADLDENYPDLTVARWQKGGEMVSLVKTWEWDNGTELKLSADRKTGSKTTVLGNIPQDKRVRWGIRFPL